MNEALIHAMTPGEQSRLAAGVYTLLGKQVKHYQRHYHLGDNTSVTVETARELSDSIRYTLASSGADLIHGDLEDALAQGQARLENRLEEAKKLLALVTATAPELAGESYYSTLGTLDQFLRRYDPRHLAHRTPDFLEYPLLTACWQDLCGIDRVIFYLRCLWQENQILACLDRPAAEDLYRRLDPDYLGNLCEQPLINALGLVLLGKSAHALALADADRRQLLELLPCPLDRAMDKLCREWDLHGPAAEYAQLVVGQLEPRLRAALERGDLSHIFL